MGEREVDSLDYEMKVVEDLGTLKTAWRKA